MMKVVIQIPCLNEAETLPKTLADLPRKLKGIDQVEWLVVDDGSTDRTSEVARDHAADYVVRLTRNRGLAGSFMAALEASLKAGADIIVNTDADNQYCADDIQKLIDPILEGKADLVIGSRAIKDINHFSGAKKLLQRLGSWVVRTVSHSDIQDAPSGFRAMTRETAKRLHVFTKYSYTIETIIQASQNGISIMSVPVRVNPPSRPSRLVRSLPSYLFHSAVTILRIFTVYKPLAAFGILGLLFLVPGFLLGVRFLIFYFSGSGEGHIQSVILAALLITIGFLLGVVGVITDLISVNRQLLERLDWQMQDKD